MGLSFFVWIPALLIFFAIAYYLYSNRNSRLNKNIVINRIYLRQLFSHVENTENAQKGYNSDISIEAVKFCREDFQASEFVVLLNEKLGKLAGDDDEE